MKTNEDFMKEIAKLSFFNSGRKLKDEDMQSTDHMFHFGYVENDKDKFSSVMILRGVYKNYESPGYILIGTLGAIIKLDIDSKTISLNFSKEEEQEGFQIELNSNVEEGEFFQQTLVNNTRHITFEHIKFMNDLVNLTNSYELTIEKKAS